MHDEDEKLRKFLSDKYGVDTSLEGIEKRAYVDRKNAIQSNPKERTKDRNANLIFACILNFIMISIVNIFIQLLILPRITLIESLLSSFVVILFVLIPFWLFRIWAIIQRDYGKGVYYWVEGISGNLIFMWCCYFFFAVLSLMGGLSFDLKI